jgi:putative ABC transport system substrate-binding protein
MRAPIGRVDGHRSHAGGQRQAATKWHSIVGCIVTLLLALLSVPLASDAQRPRTIPRVAYLALAPGPWAISSEAFVQGLGDLGYVEGQNLILEYRWSAGSVERLREHAAELVRLGVDVIVTGGPLATRAAKDLTSTIPIVMARDFDPVADGFVASLGRPGGNITGVSALTRELSGKRLELLKDMVPGLARVAILWNPVEISAARQLRDTEDAARGLGLQVHALEIRGLDDFAGAFAAALKGGAGSLTVLADPVTLFHRARLVDLATQSRLPTMYWDRVFVEAGGLMSYAASDRDMNRRAAYYVDRLLKGATPADLPVEQPTTFELVINLRTAQALGITIPPNIRFRADEVIE